MAMMIYLLCAFTSLLVAALLFRGYRQSRARLLLWSSVCFGGLFLNNVLLVIDARLAAAVDLEVWRTLPALLGIAALLYGLVWESDT